MTIMVRVASTLAAVAALASVSVADAYELKHTSSGLPVHWASSSVTFEVDPSVTKEFQDGVSAVSEALSGWSGQSGAPALSVTKGSGGVKPGNDGHNVVFYEPDGYEGAGEALAVTVLSYDPTTGEIADADIVISGKHSLAVLSASAKPAANAKAVSTEGDDDGAGPAQTFDLVHVVAHEVGHTLGLADDPTNAGPLMYLYTLPDDASARTPQTDDLQGIESLYADSASSPTSTSSSAGCSQASIASDVSGSGARDMSFVAFASVGLACMRRRRGHAVR